MIPGFLIAIVTFPGVIVHELGHFVFCRLFKLPILDVCFFRVGNPAGYVIHGAPKNTAQQMLITFRPFIVNTVLEALIAAPAAITVIQFEAGRPLDYLLIWLGVSIAMHAFPSTGDAKSLWQGVWHGEASFAAKLLAVPLVGIINAGALGSMAWLDLLYGIGMAMLFPKLLISLFA